MSITGRIKQTRVFGPSLELRRTISGTLGKATLTIQDSVINVANTPSPHMLLYHFNFGWPLADEGSDILWKGPWTALTPNPVIFKEGNKFRKCPAPLDKHDGTGEEVAIIDPDEDADGKCVCGLVNQTLGLAVALHFKKKQLPWLTNWQHWGKGEYVTGLEPGTNPPIGQTKARNQKQLTFLSPGEIRDYDIHLEIIDNEKSISEFLKKTKP